MVRRRHGIARARDTDETNTVTTVWAMLCTDPTIVPEQIIAWFVRRWQMETTFAEVRRHLGVETQRQWTDNAIGRTTPALLGLFSLVTLLAHPHLRERSDPIRQAAWYRKRAPTFADALAVVRREIWAQATFRMSGDDARYDQSPACAPRTLDRDALLRRLIGESRD